MLKDKTILVTGGTRGIGAAIVKKCVEYNANVIFTYRNSANKADELCELLSKDEVYIKSYKSDAASYSDCENLIAKIIEENGKIDVLVNNAGITRDNLMLRMSEEQWDEVMANNLKSVFNLTKQVIKPMMKNRAGSIINLSSIVGVQGNAGQANYAATKAGVIGFTKSIAREIGSRNIRCNAIAPGFIATEMTDELDEKTRDNYLSNIPAKRFGKVDEVAELVAFLASDKAAYINGQVINICGGLCT